MESFFIPGLIGSLATFFYVLIVFDHVRTSRYLKESKEAGYKIFREIINEKLWEGERLNLIHHRRNDEHTCKRNNKQYIEFRDYLCKSNSDDYLLIGIRIDGYRFKLTVEAYCFLDEEEAKEWVSEDVDKYIEVYGEPELV